MRHDDVYEIICSTDTPIIIAKSKKDEVKVAPFKDVKNGAVVLSNAIKNVFSPISGSSLERQGSSFETLSSDDMKEMKEVAHCKCGATLLTTAELAESLDKHSLHCVVCGQEIEPEEEEDELEVEEDEELEESSDEMPEDDEEVEIDIEDEDLEESSDAEDDSEAEDDDEEIEIEDEEEDEEIEESSDEAEDDVDVEDDAESEEEIDDAEIEESCDESTDKPVEEAPESDEDAEIEGSSDEDDMAEDEDSEETDEGVELEVEEKEEEEPEQACVKFNCLSAVDKIHNLELVKCECGYRVLVNGNPVASAFREQASESLNPLFDDVRALTKAMSAAISEEGFSNEVKASFGIKPLMVKVPMDSAAKQKYDEIQASVRESISKEYEEKHQQFMERFSQSMTIASVGVNKGLYGNNLLTASLIKSLAASGQEDAEDVVNEIMSKYGEDYLKQIIEKAQELVSKSDDVRNETASLVKAATFSKSKAVNLAHTAVEPKVEVSKPVETTASTNKYSDLF